RKVAQNRSATRGDGAGSRGGAHAPAHRTGGHGGGHAPAHRNGQAPARRGGGGGHTGGKPAHRGPSSHGARSGGGPRGNDARLQAILDRHVPVSGTGSKAQGSGGAHRRGGR